MTALPYPLAKLLKDKGWPQPDQMWDGHPSAGKGEFINESDDFTYSPSLDELIEGCPRQLGTSSKSYADNFYLEATSYNNGWRAGYRVQDDPSHFVAHGASAKEAIANLWLALKEEGKI